MRPTRVEIDLCAIKRNIGAIRARTGTRIMMAIKADAYGHGAGVVGRFVQERNLVDMLGVSCIEEGISLREAGVSLPILIFGLITRSMEDCDAVFSYHLMPTLADDSLVDLLVEGSSRWNRPITVHLKTDTGMGRLGLAPAETVKLASKVAATRELVIGGVYTHFPVSDIPGHAFTHDQIEKFNAFVQDLKALGISPGLVHCANSGAILNHRESFMDIVRPGILCYGLYPSEDHDHSLQVTPAMTLKTAVMFTKRVKKGTGLSYGLTYQPPRDTYIATIPIGYADGFPRVLSNKARVTIDGKTYPVVGRVCMDQSLVDLGEDVYPAGQEVIVFGRAEVTATQVAAWANTIPYEITCDMSRRVPRTYAGERSE
jgi:alanine racemase